VSNVVALEDFNDAKPQGHFSPRQLDQRDYVQQLKERMAFNYRAVLQHLWPAGRFIGSEFVVGDAGGKPGQSFKISCRSDRMGVGQDFAEGVVVGDLLDCWTVAKYGRAARGRQFAEVCEEIEQFLGSPFKPQPKVEKKQPHDLPPPSAQYHYTDPAGTVLVTVYRYELPELDARGKPKKHFRPWHVANKRYEAPKDGRPLYNLVGINNQPWVAFVEGEGKADALIKAGVPATCIMSGCKAPIEKNDWQPLQGKHVIVWPDADDEGHAFAAKVAEKLGTLASSVAILKVPDGKPKGWDAADAIAEGVDVMAMLNEATGHGAAKPHVRTIDLEKWRASTFAGEPKAVAWLVGGAIPLGTAGLLVAMGDAGKGIVTLDLALKVALPKEDGGLTGEVIDALGGPVEATGAVVILAAEDDRDEIHRRLHHLDGDGRRFGKDVRLYVVPLPNDGGPIPIVKTSSTEGPYVTPEWHALRETLLAVPDLRLVVFDPLASFVHADVNADPAAGAFVTGTLASLATETGAAVMVCHHMSKTTKPITTPEEARAAIRGSTAIVDGMRFAYALWHAEEQDARRACAALGTDWQRGRVLKGAVVKSNAPADRTIRTYVRDLGSGLLVDHTARLQGNRGYRHENELDTLCDALTNAASAGYPYTASGNTGVWERRGELPDIFHNVGRDRLRSLVDELMNKGRLGRVRYRGQSSQWLDAPDGDFSRGLVELSMGSYRKEST
jgi:hypothetical protein